MAAKSKGGGTGRGTGSKGWTRWNKTAKPARPAKGAKGAPTTGPGAKATSGSKSNIVKKSGSSGSS